MKLTTWNVNGLRALLNKDGWDWVSEFSPDVLCLQEIKAMPDQLTEEQHALFEGYTAGVEPSGAQRLQRGGDLLEIGSAEHTGFGD